MRFRVPKTPLTVFSHRIGTGVRCKTVLALKCDVRMRALLEAPLCVLVRLFSVNMALGLAVYARKYPSQKSLCTCKTGLELVFGHTNTRNHPGVPYTTPNFA